MNKTKGKMIQSTRNTVNHPLQECRSTQNINDTINMNWFGRRVKTQTGWIQTDSIECSIIYTKNGHSIYKTRRRPLHRSTTQKSKLIANSQLRSTFCGQFPDRNHHTRPWRSTSLGRWTVMTEWILQSRQSTSSLVEPQSSP